MAGYISIRKSIRWLPDEASEHTTTIVLTSPQKMFVDLRICGTEGGELPLSKLDWAIAGTTSSTICKIDGKQVSRSRFEHWIDSRTSTPENSTDEGDMYPQEDGTTLEKGVMVNPDTGINTAYEEVWEDKEVLFSDSAQMCVVLKYESDGNRGLVIKLGNYCQGFMKIGEKMSLERWKLNDRAVCLVKMGMDELPCKLAIEKHFVLGEEVQVDNRLWTAIDIA